MSSTPSPKPFSWEYRPTALAKEAFHITGGRPLSGSVRVSGAKNAALKMMAASVLTGERLHLENVPEILDIEVLRDTLRDLGVTVEREADGSMDLTAGDVEWLFVPLEAAAKMRASFMLLGPLLARFGRVIISNPGGDRIGRRPVNLHVDAMRALGAEIDYRDGYYFAKSSGRLRGAQITFPHVTVMGTENAMLAAVLAKGTTRITPAAQEPEIDDLITLLNAMGAQVARTAPDVIEIQGVDALHGATHRVMPDRIEAGTFATAAAVVGGSIEIQEIEPSHLTSFLELLERTGVEHSVSGKSLRVTGKPQGEGSYKATDITTAPYPGLATDLQPSAGLILTRAEGVSNIHETIFEDRLEWLVGLRSFGAQVEIKDARHARLTGPTAFHAAEANIPDLRAGATLMLAALAAPGESKIHGAHHIRRGYATIEEKFRGLGADLTHVSEEGSRAE
ncbi:MAG: UDP-N-acetylglucosamine 1-carboxyvinyltransferase [Chloroflexi bacterium]|nr:MAG: UDP-N-acetylglucosamine 1-carboxyvinyltransferase [Chloroflexota bacterium]